MSAPSSAIIVGAGWAGLAAAVELSRQGVAVSVYESARQAGGRARSVHLGGLELDNGQHLLIGAYGETLRLLRLCGLDEEEALQRRRLRLVLRDGDETLDLRTPPLPAPLHLALGLISARGLDWGDKRRALGLFRALQRQRFALAEDCSVGELLAAHHQTPRLTRRLWEPLCLATLNLPVAEASARVFLRVLRDAFARRRHDADLLFPRRPLGRLLPQAAAAFLEAQGGTLHTSQRVKALHSTEGRATGVYLADGRLLRADQVVLATAPHSAAHLLAGLAPLAPLAERLTSLGSAPISTVYLRYPPKVALGTEMVGLLGGHSQWVCDWGRLCGQPGWMAVVISGDGPHMALDKASLAREVAGELAAAFPHWPPAGEVEVIRERRATFRCDPAGAARRPGNATALPGLWLAGDYTDTGYPATLEGAVRSGVQCARQILG